MKISNSKVIGVSPINVDAPLKKIVPYKSQEH
jgi:hypothetical protein